MELKEIFKQVMGYYPTTNMEDVRIMNIISRTINVVCLNILISNPAKDAITSSQQTITNDMLAQVVTSTTQRINTSSPK